MFAANLFENPLVLVALVLAGAISNWLMKRRQAGETPSPGETEGSPPRAATERPARPPELPDILRQLLGGAPAAAAAPPPIHPALRESQSWSAEGDEDQSLANSESPDESRESDSGFRPSRPPVAESPQRHPITATARATRSAAADHRAAVTSRFDSLYSEDRRAAREMPSVHRRHSWAGAQRRQLWREPHAVRRAFVASLIFAPPKGLEA